MPGYWACAPAQAACSAAPALPAPTKQETKAPPVVENDDLGLGLGDDAVAKAEAEAKAKATKSPDPEPKVEKKYKKGGKE